MVKDTGRLKILVTVLDDGYGGIGVLSPTLDENGIPLDTLEQIRNDIYNKSLDQGLNVFVEQLLPVEGIAYTYDSIIMLPQDFFEITMGITAEDDITSYINKVLLATVILFTIHHKLKSLIIVHS